MNFMISLLGWFLWNYVELLIEQRSLDEDGNPQTNFSFGDFVRKKKYSWIGSLACIPLLLWIGSKELSLDPFAPVIGVSLGWNDLYLLAAGPALEILIFFVLFVKKWIKKKGTE